MPPKVPLEALKLDFFSQLVFDNIPISFVDGHKHLGVTLSSTGQWHSFIENIVSNKSFGNYAKT